MDGILGRWLRHFRGEPRPRRRRCYRRSHSNESAGGRAAAQTPHCACFWLRWLFSDPSGARWWIVKGRLLARVRVVFFHPPGAGWQFCFFSSHPSVFVLRRRAMFSFAQPVSSGNKGETVWSRGVEFDSFFELLGTRRLATRRPVYKFFSLKINTSSTTRFSLRTTQLQRFHLHLIQKVLGVVIKISS